MVIIANFILSTGSIIMKFLTVILYLIPLLGFNQFGEAEKLVANYNSPYGTCSFDADGDGDEDYVAGYYKNILWYENVGGNEFHIGRFVSTADELTSIVSADVDSDGFMDLLFTDESGLFLIKGADGGIFEEAISIDGSNAKCVDVEDIDGDGDLDAVASYSSSPRVRWYENDGEGNFDSMIGLAGLGAPQELCATDLDGDGDFDVAVVYSDGDGKVAWYENEGAGVFGGQIEIALLLPDGNYIVPGDIDADGDTDLVAGGKNGDVYTAVKYYENDGTGVFTEHGVISSPWPIYMDIELFDYDGDGFLDLITANSYSDRIVAYPFDGFEFGDAITIAEPLNCHIIRIIDADGDENIDLLTSRRDDGSDGAGDVVLLKNNGDGTFDDNGFINNAIAWPNKLVLPTDINTDGHTDVVYVQNGNLEYVRNKGVTGFDQRFILEDELGISQYAVGDINGNGYIDAVVSDLSSDELFWMENDGSANFGDPQLIDDDIGFERTIVVDDLNGDGFGDVFYAASDKICVYMNEGDGVFAAPLLLLEEFFNPLEIVSFDIDGDGDKEIFSFSKVTLELFYFENLDGDSFGPYELIATLPYDQIDMDFGDLNGDGFIDLVSMRWSPISEVYWYPNVEGVFEAAIAIGVGPELGKGLKPMDLDADGDIDIGVVSNYVTAEEIGWFENFGDGLFSDEYQFIAEAKGYHLFGADFDEDGDVDPGVVAINESYIATYENFHYSNLRVEGNLFVDVNLNGILDSSDVGMMYSNVNSIPEGDFAFAAPSGAYFMNFADTNGVYLLLPEELEHWSIVTDSLSYLIEINETFDSIDSLDFGFYPDSLFDAVTVDLVGAFPRCNTVVNYWLNTRNSGTTIPSGNIKLILDDSLTFITSSVIPDSIVDQTIYWSYDSLLYFSDYQIKVDVEMPDYATEGDTLLSILQATVDSLGEMVYADTVILEQVLNCNYDPNDKIASPAGADSLGFIPDYTSELDYTIRFQNTGLDTVITVLIKDQLDTNLVWESIEILSASHVLEAEMNDDGLLEFRFENIMLPDSNVNELGSHGYIKYRMQLEEEVMIGNSIYNSANIYFDCNPVIITNTKINTLYNCEFILASLEAELGVCQNNTWTTELLVAPSNATYLWLIDDFVENDESNLVWMADSVGVFEVSLDITTDFCLIDSTFELEVWPLELTHFDTSNICLGDSLLIFENYQTTPSTYYDTLSTVFGCDSILIQVLTVYELPEVDFIDLDDGTICIDTEIINLIASPSGGEFSGIGVSYSDFNPLLAGEGEHTLYYTYEADNGCSNTDSVAITVVDCLSLPKENQNQITVFPNPFDDYTMITFGESLDENRTIIIHNMLGEEVYRNENVTGTSLEIKKDQLGIGVYILSLCNTDSEEMFSTKLLVE